MRRTWDPVICFCMSLTWRQNLRRKEQAFAVGGVEASKLRCALTVAPTFQVMRPGHHTAISKQSPIEVELPEEY